MWKPNVTVITAFLILNANTYAQKQKPFALLPKSAAHSLSRLCSREGLPNVDGSWRPTKYDIELLESRLADISRLRSKGALKSIQISQPGRYYRQYIAVVVGGHRLIYVNAFSHRPTSFWRTRLVDICDTGPSEWGVLYDPGTGSFSDLRTNAILAPPTTSGWLLKSGECAKNRVVSVTAMFQQRERLDERYLATHITKVSSSSS
ncbi:MAG: hypothetical protein DMG96_28705 [Acidobacteria bacterium]|nr:MAG: hypothetical protein DMG96_28705 [Acidobacteriota bacterium]